MDQSLLTFNDVVGVTQECALDSDFPVSFDLKPGEIGIFKDGMKASSLARLAAMRGMILQGSISIMGTNVHASDKPSVYLSHGFTKHFRTSIGFCHHSGGLLANMTLLQNVMLPAHYHSGNSDPEPFYEMARDLLTDMNVPEEFWKLRPSDVPLEFQKRVLFSRSIINNPTILILDEPTMHIPWSQINEIVDWIVRQKEDGKGILIATGDDPFACLIGDWMIDVKNKISIFNKEEMRFFLGDVVCESSTLITKQKGLGKTHAT